MKAHRRTLLLALTAVLLAGVGGAQSPAVMRGAVRDDLQLSLLLQDGARRFATGSSLLIELRLDNLRAEARTLESLRACGSSLGRSDGLLFHFRDDTGATVTVANAYIDSADVHPHAPLVVAGRGALSAVFDVGGLANASGRLFTMLRESGSVSVTIEIPALGLTSGTAVLVVNGN